MNTLKELEKEIEIVKKEFQIPQDDLKTLKGLTKSDSQKLTLDTEIKSLFEQNDDAEKNFNQNPSWIHRTRLDALQLLERSLVCDDIKEKVFEKIDELTKNLS